MIYKSKYTNKKYKEYLQKKKLTERKAVDSKQLRVQGFAKNLTDNITPHEKIVKSYLDFIGLHYKFQKIFYTKDKRKIPMIVDFYIDDYKLVIEIDGSQHTYDAKQKQKDVLRDSYFAKLGIFTLRVKNNDLEKMSLDQFKRLLKNCQ